MKHTTRAILLAMILMFAFLTGFSYSDLQSAHGGNGVVASLVQVPGRLVAAVTTAVSDSGADLSPVETYGNVFGYLDSNYFKKKPDSTQLTYAAIRGMLASLGDKYTRFLDPEHYKQMQEENRGDFQGIGAQLEKKDGEVIVQKPLPNSPATKAGVKPGDAILKVDDKITHGMEIDDVVKRIRGERGTKVKLTLRRHGVAQPFDVSITRDVISTQVVEWKMADDKDKIGYISLAQFTEKSDEQFDEALNKLEAKGMKGFVLDLRSNPGGLLDVAVDIGSRLIPSGDIVLIQQNGRLNPLTVDVSKQNHKFYPMAVLINGMSASASEILSGAIRDHKRGTIIGTESYGKGLVQTIITLEDGSAVSITTARYLTPNHRDVNKEKIQPDIVIKPTDEQLKNNDDVQLKKGIEVVKEKLGVH